MGMPSGGCSATVPPSEGAALGVSDALGLGEGSVLSTGWDSLGEVVGGTLSLGLVEGVTLGDVLGAVLSLG